METIDKSIGMEYCMDDEDFYHEILSTYIEECPEHKAELKEALDAGDIQNYTVKIHAVKSTSKMIGAMGFADKAYALEMAGKEGRMDDIRAGHEACMAAYDEVVAEAQKLLNA